MKKSLLSLFGTGLLTLGFIAVQAQDRYAEEIFTDNEIQVTTDVTYGINIDFLTSDFSGDISSEVTQLQTIASTTGDYPAEYFDPGSETSLKLKDIKMDIYEPDQEVDSETERPLFIYIHTGNFLPPPVNGSPVGLKSDSLAIVACTQWAKRGFVAASVDYRLGWNPLAGSVVERRATLLNAVYRAIHDVKQSVRYLREDAANDNTYAIDPNKIVLFGEGSGGYVALAYATLDEYEELTIQKFINPITSEPYVDTTQVGNLEGFNGDLTLYRPNGQSSEVNMTANVGGALGDIGWLEAGDPAMVAFHAIRDDFAPFDDGTVIVPTTNEDVVDVSGSNVFIQKAVDLGNNSSFENFPNDPYTERARSLYGDTYDISNGQQVTVNSNPEGLFPVLIELRPFLTNTAAPWQWWDPNSPLAQAVIDEQSGTTAHQASLASNPNMSPQQGRTYLDTIQGYMIPRVMCELQLPGVECVSSLEESPNAKFTEIYPNPANSQVTIENNEAAIETIRVFDISGKMVLQVSPNNRQTIVDTKSLSPGAYTIQSVFEDGVGSDKLMIVR